MIKGDHMVEQPVFVKIDEYKDAMNLLDTIKSKITEANKTITKINDLIAKEETELERWKAQVEEVETKIGFIDKTLFEQS